jgi:predicted N-acetyltransferase YhbS
MTHADVEAAADAIGRSGWGDRRTRLAWSTSHPGCRPLVADADGTIVGTGMATINGSVGWIGTIWVDPAWRGQGLGTALTQTTIEVAQAAGCATLLLVATEAGQPLYERLGFRVQDRYRTMEAAGLATGDPDERIRPFQASDLTAMLVLDGVVTGEDRAHMLTALAGPDTTRCLERPDGTLGGFVIRAPWGGGATIAPDPEDALAILHARRLAAGSGKRVRAGVLETNHVGFDRLRHHGWVDAWQAPRLIRGEMPAWRPEAIWGQFDHAVG